MFRRLMQVPAARPSRRRSASSRQGYERKGPATSRESEVVEGPGVGYGDAVEALVDQALGQRQRLGLLPVDEEQAVERGAARVDEAQEIRLVGVARERGDVDDLRLDRNIEAEDPHLRAVLEEPPAQRVTRLEAHQQDCVALVLEVVSEVVDDAPGLAHAAPRDDDRRL